MKPMSVYNQQANISNQKYRKEHQKTVALGFKKEYYNDILKPAADMMDEPVATFIKKAIEERLDRIYGKLVEDRDVK